MMSFLKNCLTKTQWRAIFMRELSTGWSVMENLDFITQALQVKASPYTLELQIPAVKCLWNPGSPVISVTLIWPSGLTKTIDVPLDSWQDFLSDLRSAISRTLNNEMWLNETGELVWGFSAFKSGWDYEGSPIHNTYDTV